MSDNKMFWKEIAPFFSSKSKKSNNITLTEGSKVNMKKCTDTFNTYFNSIVKDQKILMNKDRLKNVIKVDDPIIASLKDTWDI